LDTSKRPPTPQDHKIVDPRLTRGLFLDKFRYLYPFVRELGDGLKEKLNLVGPATKGRWRRKTKTNSKLQRGPVRPQWLQDIDELAKFFGWI